jgi:hypothetical protein
MVKCCIQLPYVFVNGICVGNGASEVEKKMKSGELAKLLIYSFDKTKSTEPTTIGRYPVSPPFRLVGALITFVVSNNLLLLSLLLQLCLLLFQITVQASREVETCRVARPQ